MNNPNPTCFLGGVGGGEWVSEKILGARVRFGPVFGTPVPPVQFESSVCYQQPRLVFLISPFQVGLLQHDDTARFQVPALGCGPIRPGESNLTSRPKFACCPSLVAKISNRTNKEPTVVRCLELKKGPKGGHGLSKVWAYLRPGRSRWAWRGRSNRSRSGKQRCGRNFRNNNDKQVNR